MNLVGTRPQDPVYFQHYTAGQRRVFRVRPGLVSAGNAAYPNEEDLLAQAGDRAEEYFLNELMPAKLRLDLEYLERRSLLLDLGILLRALRGIAGTLAAGDRGRPVAAARLRDIQQGPGGENDRQTQPGVRQRNRKGDARRPGLCRRVPQRVGYRPGTQRRSEHRRRAGFHPGAGLSRPAGNHRRRRFRHVRHRRLHQAGLSGGAAGSHPLQTTPNGLNAALDAANGQVVVRCDVHATLPPEYVRRGVATLQATGAGVVGGRQRPGGPGPPGSAP